MTAPLVISAGSSSLTMHLLTGRKVHVVLNGNGLVADDKIEGDILGIGLQFFDDLIQSPSGWDGTKAWQSLEGELTLTATCDRTGHVTLEARLGTEWSGHGWSAAAYLHLELGQLPALRHRIALFEQALFAAA